MIFYTSRLVSSTLEPWFLTYNLLFPATTISHLKTSRQMRFKRPLFHFSPFGVVWTPKGQQLCFLPQTLAFCVLKRIAKIQINYITLRPKALNQVKAYKINIFHYSDTKQHHWIFFSDFSGRTTWGCLDVRSKGLCTYGVRGSGRTA